MERFRVGGAYASCAEGPFGVFGQDASRDCVAEKWEPIELGREYCFLSNSRNQTFLARTKRRLGLEANHGKTDSFH